jgi:hypothetical protein
MDRFCADPTGLYDRRDDEISLDESSGSESER